MAIFDYGIGGNEIKVDANEAIADIPSNRTLLVQKLTDEAPVAPEAIYGLETVEDVFEKFSPSVELDYSDEEGNEVKEKMDFKNLGDFSVKKLIENSDFLNKLNVEKEQNVKISRQLSTNRALLKALQDPEARDAFVKTLEESIKEIEEAQK